MVDPATGELDKALIFKRCQENVPDWKEIKIEDCEIKRMGGLSNVCCKVSAPGAQTILYRLIMNDLANADLERVIFRVASDEKVGPKFLHEDADYRLEGFFEGRAISVWEMRNPTIMMNFCDKIFDYNFNPAIRAACEKVEAINPDKLYIDFAINEWAPQVKEQFPSWRGKLLQDNGKPHPESLRTIDTFERTFLFDGYQDYFRKLVPRDSHIIMAHNDAQENNVLARLEKNSDLLLIDFEYSGWQPMAHDLANYLNEMVLDNCHPCGNGIALYLENDPTEPEIEAFLTRYLHNYFTKVLKKESAEWDGWIKAELPKFNQEVRRCRMLATFYWAIWSFKILKAENVCDDKVFNYDYANTQIAYFRKNKERWGL